MRPVAFVQSNYLLKADERGSDEKIDVPCFVGADATVICFDVSDEEIEAMKNTGRIWLIVKGHYLPAMELTIEIPMKDPEDYDFPELLEP